MKLLAKLFTRPVPEIVARLPIAHPEYLHHSTVRAEDEIWPINWDAMRERDLTRGERV